MNTQGIKEISSVSFGVFSPKKLLKYQYVMLHHPKNQIQHGL